MQPILTLLLSALALAPADSILAPGVSLALAELRARQLDSIAYHFDLDIPAGADAPITGAGVVSFHYRTGLGPLVLDFAPGADGRVRAVHVNGRPRPYERAAGHIVLADEVLLPGRNRVRIDFVAGDASLNRRSDFLYTLFVPARAHEALPLFDQPGLKARYSLTLEVPAEWEAVANGRTLGRTELDGRARYRYATTEPISSYLFAFVAGAFRQETAVRDGRTLTMYHRETDADKLARNLEAIFDLHAGALAWLEDYTGIRYPFGDFEFVLVPSFQYSGMEHPGAILYRASSLLLDEAATEAERLGRASLIAHETAHMWFGDLVTMEWFDDVWTKEVFANFMAAKIVNPAFPDVDHALRFLLAHYPDAYAVDRTAGSNPIRQPLDNLADAGSLYGAIIYQKAPIMMRQLERMIGTESFRNGLREYLDRYGYGNARWPDLVAILDERTPEDLEAWSRVWVGEPGRPVLRTEIELRDGRIASLRLRQEDPRGDRVWPQQLDVLLGYDRSVEPVHVQMDGAVVDIEPARGRPAPDFVLLEDAYGRHAASAATLRHVGVNLARLDSATVRGLAWLTLWDAMLERDLPPEWLLDQAIEALASEADPLVIERMLEDVETLFWRYLPPDRRTAWAERLEYVLWQQVATRPASGMKSAFFDSWRSIATTPAAVERMARIWEREQAVEGLELSERDLTRLAHALAVREARPGVLDEQRERIENPDRLEEFDFVVPALSPDPVVRDSFFQSLRSPGARAREPWVLTGLRYLHHPLRADASVRYIRPGLELLEEVHRTGDIFFPLRWLHATLDGHQSVEAARIVTNFLATHPDYPPRLRQKILQAADGLLRAARLDR